MLSVYTIGRAFEFAAFHAGNAVLIGFALVGTIGVGIVFALGKAIKPLDTGAASGTAFSGSSRSLFKGRRLAPVGVIIVFSTEGVAFALAAIVAFPGAYI
jgi:hypothetical protein